MSTAAVSMRVGVERTKRRGARCIYAEKGWRRESGERRGFQRGKSKRRDGQDGDGDGVEEGNRWGIVEASGSGRGESRKHGNLIDGGRAPHAPRFIRSGRGLRRQKARGRSTLYGLMRANIRSYKQE